MFKVVGRVQVEDRVLVLGIEVIKTCFAIIIFFGHSTN
jgi:hypothetical protein